MKFWGAATVGTKGQVVIPAEARELLNIKVGEKLVVMGTPMKNGVLFIKADSIEEIMEHMQRDITQMHKSANTPEGETV